MSNVTPPDGELRERFWEHHALTALNTAEWEALCDGCGQCCLLKFEDEDNGDIAVLDVACRLLDVNKVSCRDYANRSTRVPGCIPLDVETVARLRWLPETCGYRRLNEGRELPEWHPLLTGDAKSVRRAGVSVSRFAVSEASVCQQDLEDHIIAIIDPES